MPHFDGMPVMKDTDLGNPQHAEAFLDVYDVDDPEHREAVEEYAAEVATEGGIDAAYALLPVIEARDEAQGVYDAHAAAIDAAIAEYTEDVRAPFKKAYRALDGARTLIDTLADDDLPVISYEELVEEMQKAHTGRSEADDIPDTAKAAIERVLGLPNERETLRDAARAFHEADTYREAREALEAVEDAAKDVEDAGLRGVLGALQSHAEKRQDDDAAHDPVERLMQKEIYFRAAPLDAE